MKRKATWNKSYMPAIYVCAHISIIFISCIMITVMHRSMITPIYCFKLAWFVPSWFIQSQLIAHDIFYDEWQRQRNSIIGSDNSLWPVRRQTMISTKCDLLFTESLGTDHIRRVGIKMKDFAFKKIDFKTSSSNTHFCSKWYIMRYGKQCGIYDIGLLGHMMARLNCGTAASYA